MARYFTSTEPVTHGDLAALLDEHMQAATDELAPWYQVEQKLDEHHSDIAEMLARLRLLETKVQELTYESEARR